MELFLLLLMAQPLQHSLIILLYVKMQIQALPWRKWPESTYQWQLSTDGGANYNNIAGATNATLNLTAVTASMNNYRYRCVLTSAGCAVPAISNAAILTVNLLAAITSTNGCNNLRRKQ